MIDDGLELTAPKPSLAMSSMDFASNLWAGFGTFISPSAKSEKEIEKSVSKEVLESKGTGFETQIADNLKAGQILSLAAIPVWRLRS